MLKKESWLDTRRGKTVGKELWTVKSRVHALANEQQKWRSWIIGMSITAFGYKRFLWGRGGEKLWVSICASVPLSTKICRVIRRDPFLEKMQKPFCVWLEDESRKQMAVVLW